MKWLNVGLVVVLLFVSGNTMALHPLRELAVICVSKEDLFITHELDRSDDVRSNVQLMREKRCGFANPGVMYEIIKFEDGVVKIRTYRNNHIEEFWTTVDNLNISDRI